MLIAPGHILLYLHYLDTYIYHKRIQEQLSLDVNPFRNGDTLINMTGLTAAESESGGVEAHKTPRLISSTHGATVNIEERSSNPTHATHRNIAAISEALE